MKIHFRLAWVRGPVTGRHFRSKPGFELFADYAGRLSHFAPVTSQGLSLARPETIPGALWFCHESASSRRMSSTQLAETLGKLLQNGTRELHIVIGPADGLTGRDLSAWKPGLLWSLSPLTLPHELAAVLAAEQVYRAFTLLKGLPYHSGH